jgi:2-methylisocitrate lyase-like PEP mutase family enzyme
VNDLDDTIDRLLAFEAAGAQVLYAPGLNTIEQVKTVVAAVNQPVNVLFAFMPQVTLDQYSAAGVRRVSLGGALANLAIGSTVAAANQISESGSFEWAKDAAPGGLVKKLLDR